MIAVGTNVELHQQIHLSRFENRSEHNLDGFVIRGGAARDILRPGVGFSKCVVVPQRPL